MPSWLRAEMRGNPLFQEEFEPAPHGSDYTLQEEFELAPYGFGYTPQEEPIPPVTPFSTSAGSREHFPTRDQVASSEIAQLRAEVEHYRDEAARYRRQARKPQMRSLARERGGCLTSWLAMQGIGISLLILVSMAHDQGPLLVCLSVPFWLFLSVVFRGLWLMKKWAYYAQMGLYILNLAVALLTTWAIHSPYLYTSPDVGIRGVIGSLIGLVTLFVLVHRRWGAFE